MIEREARYYTTGYEGQDPCKAPFYLRSLIFDGKEGDYNAGLVNSFNIFLKQNKVFPECALKMDEAGPRAFPSKIIVINASHDNLPTSYETARIFDDWCFEKGFDISSKVVNTREELMACLGNNPENILVMSQCVDKHVYNVKLAEELEKKGVVIVPGRLTAPGAVFSDKDRTYKLLSNDGKDWSEVARYIKVPIDDNGIDEVADSLLASIDRLAEETGGATFFVKPHEGGGGLGGFRITKVKDGYIIPDLSKVTGEATEVHPTFIDFDVKDRAKLRELLWVYKLFAGDEKMSANYLKVKLPLTGKTEDEAMDILKNYIASTGKKRREKLFRLKLTKEKARVRLIKAVEIFEKKFTRRYTPLVNEHIDFGLWGLRAHYRLSRAGIVLEAMYHRVFQLAFTEEGIGYLGSDNISNKQTGELEILRLGPLNEIMVEAIGGEKLLFESLVKGARALVLLAGFAEEEEEKRIPLRLQLDLAAVSRKIGEGNADTARGICLASRWTEFVRNTCEWLEDSLAYYSWKRSKIVRL